MAEVPWGVARAAMVSVERSMIRTVTLRGAVHQVKRARCANVQAPIFGQTVTHGLQSVLHKIDEDLLNLNWIDGDDAIVGRQIERQLNIRPNNVLSAKGDNLLHQYVDVYICYCARIGLNEVANATYDLSGPQRSPFDMANVLLESPLAARFRWLR